LYIRCVGKFRRNFAKYDRIASKSEEILPRRKSSLRHDRVLSKLDAISHPACPSIVTMRGVFLLIQRISNRDSQSFCPKTPVPPKSSHVPENFDILQKIQKNRVPPKNKASNLALISRRLILE
jgi:hypothetical protein